MPRGSIPGVDPDRPAKEMLTFGGAELDERSGDEPSALRRPRGAQAVADSSNGLDHVGVYAELLP